VRSAVSTFSFSETCVGIQSRSTRASAASWLQSSLTNNFPPSPHLPSFKTYQHPARSSFAKEFADKQKTSSRGAGQVAKFAIKTKGVSFSVSLRLGAFAWSS
jgi:hypothetical protein